jgi:nicotinamidase-related amidase
MRADISVEVTVPRRKTGSAPWEEDEMTRARMVAAPIVARIGALVGAFGFALAAIGTAAVPANATNVVANWSSVKIPPAPALKPVTVDPRTTALLMLDFLHQNCGKRPTCLASLPAMKKLLAEARAAKALVLYSGVGTTTTADVLKDVAPISGEPFVRSGPDKFVNTPLARILKGRGIKTVIVAGTASNGAVLFTAAGAAFRGMKVIVPVDGMSAVNPFADLSTAFTFVNAPAVSQASTLTRSDMIRF